MFALGGGTGAATRHLLTRVVTHRYPLSTLVVNVVGSFVLGVGTGLLDGTSGPLAEELRRLVFGFCGGFTTFSSFACQSLDLHRRATIVHAVANVTTNLVLCLAAYGIGLALG